MSIVHCVRVCQRLDLRVLLCEGAGLAGNCECERIGVLRVPSVLLCERCVRETSK